MTGLTYTRLAKQETQTIMGHCWSITMKREGRRRQEKTKGWKAAAIQMLRVCFRQESLFAHKSLRDNKTGLTSRRGLEFWEKQWSGIEDMEEKVFISRVIYGKLTLMTEQKPAWISDKRRKGLLNIFHPPKLHPTLSRTKSSYQWPAVQGHGTRWASSADGEHTLRVCTRLAKLLADISICLLKIGQMDESWKVVDIMGTRNRPVSLGIALGNSWESS